MLLCAIDFSAFFAPATTETLQNFSVSKAPIRKCGFSEFSKIGSVCAFVLT
jgi:hypothetical protein